MSEYDYGAWLDRAADFVRKGKEVHGDLFEGECQFSMSSSEEILHNVEGEMGKLPEGLRDFFGAATVVDFWYRLLPGGEGEEEKRPLAQGALNIILDDLPKLKSDCEGWANETWIAEEPEIQQVWLEAIPFASLPNGDFLAVSPGGETQNEVVYLNHEDEGFTIAPSFAAFLHDWEALFYLGPEHWVLEPFLDPASNRLVAEGEEFENLRKEINESGD